MKLLPLYMHITYIRFFFGGWGGVGVGVGVGVGRVSQNCENNYQFRHVCLSARFPTTWNNSVPTSPFFLQFYI